MFSKKLVVVDGVCHHKRRELETAVIVVFYIMVLWKSLEKFNFLGDSKPRGREFESRYNLTFGFGV